MTQAAQRQPQPDRQEGATPLHTDMPVGEILRRTREHYGQSLDDVENNIRIRASQLDAIEKNNMEALPGRVYAIGFVRSYAEYLRLDGDKMVQLFKMQGAGGTPAAQLNFPIPASESRLPPPWVLAACAGGLIFVIILFSIFGSEKETQVTQIKDVPSQYADLVEGGELSSDAEQGGQANQADISDLSSSLSAGQNTDSDEALSPGQLLEERIDNADGIVLRLKDRSWVEIKDGSGKAIVSRVLNKDEQYFVPDSPDLRMSLGNAGAIEASIDGVVLNPFGERGEVRRNISLDIQSLKSLVPGLEER